MTDVKSDDKPDSKTTDTETVTAKTFCASDLLGQQVWFEGKRGGLGMNDVKHSNLANCPTSVSTDAQSYLGYGLRDIGLPIFCRGTVEKDKYGHPRLFMTHCYGKLDEIPKDELHMLYRFTGDKTLVKCF